MAGVARGAAGVAHRHHEVAVVEPAGRYGEVVRRLVGHVVRRMVRGVARRRDIRAVEGEVARVPGPAPVVDVAAVAADGVRRCVDEAQVADFEVLDELVLQTAEEAAHPAPMTRVGLAFLHRGLAPVFHRLVAVAGRKRGIETVGNPLRHVLGVDRHEDPGTRRRWEFLRHGRGQESLFEVVAVRFRVELNRAPGAMMVGDHKALGRHERRAATAERNHRGHGERGEVVELVGIQLQPRFAQIGGDGRQLVRREHPLPGMRNGRPAHDGGHDGPNGNEPHGIGHRVAMAHQVADHSPSDILFIPVAGRLPPTVSAGRRRPRRAARVPATARRRRATCPSTGGRAGRIPSAGRRSRRAPSV